MKTSDTIIKIAPALVKAHSAIKAIGKSGHNKFDNYRYATLLDYIETARPVLEKHGLCLIYGMAESVRLPDRLTKKGGTEYAVQVRMPVRIIHESGEWVEVEVFGEGQDRADKAIYKANTGARKYGVACILGLATTDDPEGDESVGDSAAPAQRSTPKNGNGEHNGAERTPKQVFMDLAREWSGCLPENINSVCKKILKSAQVKVNGTAKDSDCIAGIQFIKNMQEQQTTYSEIG